MLRNLDFKRITFLRVGSGVPLQIPSRNANIVSGLVAVFFFSMHLTCELSTSHKLNSYEGYSDIGIRGN